MRLLLVRHGHTADIDALIYSGQRETPLSPLGERQAAALGTHLASAPLAAIYSSDLSRALLTATAVAEPHSLPVLLDPDLREISLGVWEGKTYAQLVAENPEGVAQWTAHPETVAPLGGETAADVRVRVRRALGWTGARHEGSVIAWVTSGGVIGVLLCDVLGIPITERWRLRCAPASITTLDFVGQPTEGARPEASIVCLNDTCHLRDILP